MEDRLRLYSQREVADLYKLGHRIYGSPLPLPHPKAKHLLPVDAARGTMGEHAVMGILNLLSLDYPEMFLFHSVGIANDRDGETDHVLLYKNRLFIIETKNYSNFASIYIDKTGTAHGKKHGNIVNVSDNDLLSKLEFYKDLFPHLDVEAVMIVTQSDLKLGSEFSRYSIIGIKQVYEFFETRIKGAKETEHSDWEVIKYFGNLCIRNEMYY